MIARLFDVVFHHHHQPDRTASQHARLAHPSAGPFCRCPLPLVDGHGRCVLCEQPYHRAA